MNSLVHEKLEIIFLAVFCFTNGGSMSLYDLAFQIFVEILMLAVYNNYSPYSSLAAFECLKLISKRSDF